jgi:hypothetical protein
VQLISNGLINELKSLFLDGKDFCSIKNRKDFWQEFRIGL